MLRVELMRHSLLLGATLALVACSEDSPTGSATAAGGSSMGGSGGAGGGRGGTAGAGTGGVAGTAGAAGAAGTGTAGAAGTGNPPINDAGMGVPCLDQPTDLPRPPSGMLPCEFLPPGFK